MSALSKAAKIGLAYALLISAASAQDVTNPNVQPFIPVPNISNTFTPDFSAGTNFTITLPHGVSVLLANPKNQVTQGGILEVIQSSSGSDSITTFGSAYLASTKPTLSTTANAKDYISYTVNSSGNIVFGSPVLNAH